MPHFVVTEQEKQLRSDGVQIECLDYATAIEHDGTSLIVTTKKGTQYQAD